MSKITSWWQNVLSSLGHLTLVLISKVDASGDFTGYRIGRVVLEKLVSLVVFVCRQSN